MPPKELTPGIHYLCEDDDQWTVIGSFTRLDESALDGEYTDDVITVKSFPTITFVVGKMTRMEELFITGYWVPNNWLKMHGHPMRRRKK